MEGLGIANTILGQLEVWQPRGFFSCLLGTVARPRPLWENTELDIGTGNLVYRTDKCGRAQIDPFSFFPDLSDFVVGIDHGILET